MDYHSLPRKQLQALCKRHAIPANSTNVFMADALSALFNVDENTKPSGNEGFQKREPFSEDRAESALTDIFNTPRRNTRAKKRGPAAEDENEDEAALSSFAFKQRVIKSASAASGRSRRKAVNESEIIGDSKVKARTRGRLKKTMNGTMVNKEESLHSSEVDETPDVVAIQRSFVKVNRGRARAGVRSVISSKKTSRGTDSEELEMEEDNQASDEKEEPLETHGDSLDVVPRATLKGLETQKYVQNERQPRKKSDKLENEEAIEGADDENKVEVTPVFKRSTRTRAAKAVDNFPVSTRSSARKKASNADSLKKSPGTSPKLSSTRKTRRTKVASMRINLSDNEKENFSVEKAVKVSAKKNLMVEIPVQTQRKLRSCRQDSKESIIEGALGESERRVQPTSSHQVQNHVQNANKVVDFDKQKQLSSELEDSDVKKDTVSRRTTTKDRRNVAHACTVGHQILASGLKGPIDVETGEEFISEEANSGIKTLLQSQSMSKSCQQDYHESAEDVFEESACNVKQLPTWMGPNPIQNIQVVLDSEKQGSQSSELEHSDGNQDELSCKEITEKTTEKKQGKVPSRCTEECQVLELVKGVDEEEFTVFIEATEDIESVETDGRMSVQDSKFCEDSSEKKCLPGISEAAGIEPVDTKDMVKVTKISGQSFVSQCLVKESCSLREVNGQNVFNIEGSVKGSIEDVSLHEKEPYNVIWSVCPYVVATHVSRPVEREFCSLSTTEQPQTVEVQESRLLEQQTACMAEAGTCTEEMAKGTCASGVEAQDLEPSTLKSQETKDEDGVGSCGGSRESSFLKHQIVFVAEEGTCDGEMAEVTCATSPEGQKLEASTHNSGKKKAETMHVDFTAEAVMAPPNAIDFRKVEEMKDVLVQYHKESKDLSVQQLDASEGFSSSAGKAAASIVEERTDFLHMDSENFSSKAMLNVFEVQDQDATEYDNVAGQNLNSSEEEYLDMETASSSDFNFLRDQHSSLNSVDGINDSAVEGRLQVIYNSSFLIDGVDEEISSDLDNTAEEDDQGIQECEDCVFVAVNTLEIQRQQVTDFPTSQELNTPKEFNSIEENLCTEAVYSNDFKKQTHLKQNSIYHLEESDKSTSEGTTKKCQDALDRAVQDQHALQDSSDGISEGVVNQSTSCEEAGFAVNLTPVPTQADDEAHVEECSCVLDVEETKLDRAQGSMAEERVQGLLSCFELHTPESPVTEELTYHKLEESFVVSKSFVVCDDNLTEVQAQDFKDKFLMDDSQGTICTFEEGKQHACGRVFSINNDSTSAQEQLVLRNAQNCGSRRPAEEEGHTLDRVSDDKTLIANQGTCTMEDVAPVSHSIADINCLKPKVMITIEASITKNQIEDQKADALEKELPGIETQGAEHAILKMAEFAVETNADGKNSSMGEETRFLCSLCSDPAMKLKVGNTESSLVHMLDGTCLGKSELTIVSEISPCLKTLEEEECSDIKCISLDKNFHRLSVSEGGLTEGSLQDHAPASLIEDQLKDLDGEDNVKKFFPAEGYVEYMKQPGNLQKVFVGLPDQDRGEQESIITEDDLQVGHVKEPGNGGDMFMDLPDQGRGEEGSNIVDSGFQVEPLELAGCKLQVQVQEKMHASIASELLNLGSLVSASDERQANPNGPFGGREPLQVNEGNPHDLNTQSLRKLRALCKKKEVQIKEAAKVNDGYPHDLNTQSLRKLQALCKRKEVQIKEAEQVKGANPLDLNGESFGLCIRKRKSK